MAYSLSSPDIKQLKRVLANRLPDAASSLLTEAMARGLAYTTNAALLSALSAGPVHASPDDQAFKTFLGRRDSVEVPDGIMSAALAELTIMAVMSREPDLFRDGMRNRHNGPFFPTSRPAMLGDASIGEFRRAVEWLGTVRQTSRIRTRRTSYGYKHMVERYHAEHHPVHLNYVSNGMFIAAALHLGYRVKREDRDSPNVEHATPCDAAGACTECGGTLRKLGGDVTEMLDYVPGSFRVIRHVMSKSSLPVRL